MAKNRLNVCVTIAISLLIMSLPRVASAQYSGCDLDCSASGDVYEATECSDGDCKGWQVWVGEWSCYAGPCVGPTYCCSTLSFPSIENAKVVNFIAVFKEGVESCTNWDDDCEWETELLDTDHTLCSCGIWT
jgi:hypothetical protein